MNTATNADQQKKFNHSASRKLQKFAKLNIKIHPYSPYPQTFRQYAFISFALLTIRLWRNTFSNRYKSPFSSSLVVKARTFMRI